VHSAGSLISMIAFFVQGLHNAFMFVLYIALYVFDVAALWHNKL